MGGHRRMTGCLRRKVALVTGGASGMGEAESALFVQEGARVFVGDIDDERGSAVAKELGSSCTYLRLDVTEPESWEAAAEVLGAECGRLDVLVNNAGVGPAAGVQPFERTELADHHRMFDVNVHGVFYGMRAMLALLEASGSASVVNVSSIDGLVGVLGMTSYTASKFAVTGMSRSAAIELGHRGIRVNSLHPGVIDTPMVAGVSAEIRLRLDELLTRQPIARAGRPAEVARMALFLASDDSSYCTGAQFTVDGGHLAGPYRDPRVGKRS